MRASSLLDDVPYWLPWYYFSSGWWKSHSQTRLTSDILDSMPIVQEFWLMHVTQMVTQYFDH